MNFNNPLISVIVPVYNAKCFLNKCVDGVLSQTYANWELILVDDGSTDGSSTICDEYVKKDNRIHCIHKENGGLSSAREAGVNAIHGLFAMFVDSDDWIDIYTIEKCVHIQQKTNAQCVCFSYVREYPDESLPVHIYDGSQNFAKGNIAQFYRRFWGLYGDELKHPERGDSLVSCCMKLYSINLLKNGKYFDTKLIGGSEDTLFNLYALADCSSAYYLDEPLYHYRKRADETLSSSYRPMLQMQYRELYKCFFKATDELKSDESCVQALNNRIMLSLIGIGLNEIKNPDGVKSIKEIRKYIRNVFYKRGYQNAQKAYLPFVWKVFIFCAGHGLATPVYIMLLAIKFLKSRV